MRFLEMCKVKERGDFIHSFRFAFLAGVGMEGQGMLDPGSTLHSLP